MTARRPGTVTVLLVVTALLAACAPAGGADEPPLRIGVQTDQPGLSQRSGSSYVGFDIAVARYVAGRLGRTPQFVPAPTGQRETLISTGQVDVVIGAYSMTAERARRVTFPGPYLDVAQDLLVPTASPIPSGPSALVGKKICAVIGSTSARRIKEHYSGVQLLELGSDAECVEALVEDAVDAVTSDDLVLAGYADQPAHRGLLKVAGRPLGRELYGIGMRKGEGALCRQVTSALRQMIVAGDWARAEQTYLSPLGFRAGQDNPPEPRSCE